MPTDHPQQNATQTLPGPNDILRSELTNGIVALSRANPNSPSVAISGFVHAGALFDPDDKLGLADFTAAALMRGTQQHSFQEIYDLLESCGASLGFSSGTHTVSFSGKALAEDLELILSLLNEALRQPTFPGEHVERLRTQLLTHLAIRAQDTAEMASLVFDKLVYGQHPYSRPEDGYPETIQAIRREHLFAFHQRHYGPRGMVIAITGGIEPQAAIEATRRIFENWQNPDQPDPYQLPPLQPLDSIKREKITLPGKSQADLLIGAAGPARTSPDFLPASIGNSILGQFGMMGRIGKSVRERAGLAYYAASGLSGGPGPGPWSISAGVDPENVEKAIELILKEVAHFTAELVSDEELSDVQTNFIGRLPLSLESNSGVAAALIRLERYQLGLDYYQRYPDLIRAVEAEQILEVAQKYLDVNRLAIAIAGP
jgi:zinc protease